MALRQNPWSWIYLLWLFWGGAHLCLSIASKDAWLGLRQSVLFGYALFLPLALLAGTTVSKRLGLLVTDLLVCIAAVVGILELSKGYVFWQGDYGFRINPASLPYYHQMTLGLGTLSLPLALSRLKLKPIQTISLATLLCAVFLSLQMQRLQSVVLCSLLAGLFIPLLLGGWAFVFRSDSTRFCSALRLCLPGLLAFPLSFIPSWFLSENPACQLNPQHPPAETRAWSPLLLWRGLECYAQADLRQASPKERAAFEAVVRGPWPEDSKAKEALHHEAYKLHVALEFVKTPSAKNNLWRLLVWRKMLMEACSKAGIFGNGFGNPWRYSALSHLPYYAGEVRLGLAPHNSYLGILHHLGWIGLLLFVLLCVSIFRSASCCWLATGDGFLLVLVGCWIFTAVFAFFTAALEGPAYGIPFWIFAGMVASRTKEMQPQP